MIQFFFLHKEMVNIVKQLNWITSSTFELFEIGVNTNPKVNVQKRPNKKDASDCSDGCRLQSITFIFGYFHMIWYGHMVTIVTKLRKHRANGCNYKDSNDYSDNDLEGVQNKVSQYRNLVIFQCSKKKNTIRDQAKQSLDNIDVFWIEKIKDSTYDSKYAQNYCTGPKGNATTTLAQHIQSLISSETVS